MSRLLQALALLCAFSALTACGGNGSNAEPEVMFDNLGGPVMALLGGTVQIDYTDNDPDDDAMTSLYADQDGDLMTTGDQVLIAMDRPEMDGTAQSVTWNTAGIPPGIYRIFAVTTDGHATVTAQAAGRVTVNNVIAFAPTNATALRGTAYNLRITFLFPLSGATVSAATVPVTIGAVQVPGTYAIENNVDITFVPDSCVFPAPATVMIDVLTTVGTTTQATGTVVATSMFSTAVSRVWAIGTNAVGEVSEVNAATETESADFALGDDDDPWFGVCSKGGTLYLSNRGKNLADGDIIVFNTASGTIASRIPLTETDTTPSVFTVPAGIRLSADEFTLYAAVFETDDVQSPGGVGYFVTINVASGMETNRITLSATGRVRNLALSPDGLRAYVAGYDSGVVYVINLATGTEVDTDGDAMNGTTPISTTEIRPSGLEMDATGAWLYVSHSGNSATGDVTTIDTATFMEGTPLANPAATGTGTPDITRDPCDGRLYLPHTNYDTTDYEGLTVFDTAGPTATVVTTDGASGYNRGVAFVFGTNLVAIGDRDQAQVLILDKTDLAAGTSAVTTSINNIVGVLTIPPMRY